MNGLGRWGRRALVGGPFLWLIISSLQSEREIVSVPPHWIPHQPTLENYGMIFAPPGVTGGVRLPEAGRFVPSSARMVLPSLRNSLLVALVVVGLNLLLGAPAAYALARIRLRGKQGLIMFTLGSRIVPDIALVIPFFLIMRTLDLLDHPGGLILTYVGLTLPFTVWILAGYFEGIPEELDQAALVDGCTRGQVLRKIILPLAAPSLFAGAVFSFMTCWNEFLFALLFTQTEQARTIPVVVSMFLSDFNISFAVMNAAAVISAIPPVVLAIAFQRYLVAGLTRGAVKG